MFHPYLFVFCNHSISELYRKNFQSANHIYNKGGKTGPKYIQIVELVQLRKKPQLAQG